MKNILLSLFDFKILKETNTIRAGIYLCLKDSETDITYYRTLRDINTYDKSKDRYNVNHTEEALNIRSFTYSKSQINNGYYDITNIVYDTNIY